MNTEAKIKSLHLEPGDVIVVVGEMEASQAWLFSDMVKDFVGRKHLIVRVDPGSDIVKIATAQAIAEEREACARIADAKEEECREAGLTTLFSMSGDVRCNEIAEAIRARGNP